MRYIFCTLLLLALVVAPVHAEAKSRDVDVSLIRSEPYPLIIGEEGRIFFSVTNTGEESIEDLEITFMPESPFSVRDTEQISWDAGSAPINSEHTYDFLLRVDKQARVGTEELTFKVQVNDRLSLEKTIPVELRERDHVLEVSDVEMQPRALQPGATGNVTLRLHNTANSLMKNIDVSVDFEEDAILPVDSTSTQRVELIQPNAEMPVTFAVKALESAEPSTYKANINLSYEDEAGNTFTRTGEVGLTVGGDPEVDITLDETDVRQTGTTGEVTLSVINKGKIEAKFALIELQETDQFKMLGPSRIYLGDIQSDDFETVSYDIHVPQNAEEAIDLPVNVSYENPEGTSFTVRRDIRIELFSEAQLYQFGLKQRNNTLLYASIVAVLVVGFFGYRYWRRRSSAE